MGTGESRSCKALGVYHLLIGLGGVAGGVGAVIDPSGAAMGISTEALKTGPFESFLIPGLFLLVIIGLANVAAAICAWRRIRIQAYLTGGLSVVMVGWIIIQVYMLWSINVLHVVYFFVGVIGLVWAGVLAAKEKLWPFSVLGPWHGVSDA